MEEIHQWEERGRRKCLKPTWKASKNVKSRSNTQRNSKRIPCYPKNRVRPQNPFTISDPNLNQIKSNSINHKLPNIKLTRTRNKKIGSGNFEITPIFTHIQKSVSRLIFFNLHSKIEMEKNFQIHKLNFYHKQKSFWN